MNLTIDNRDLSEVNAYLEARIEALIHRVKELEVENQKLIEALASAYMEGVKQ